MKRKHMKRYWGEVDHAVPQTFLVDDFDKSMKFLTKRGALEGVEIKLLEAWKKVDPFAGFSGSKESFCE